MANEHRLLCPACEDGDHENHTYDFRGSLATTYPSAIAEAQHYQHRSIRGLSANASYALEICECDECHEVK